MKRKGVRQNYLFVKIKILSFNFSCLHVLVAENQFATKAERLKESTTKKNKAIILQINYRLLYGLNNTEFWLTPQRDG